MKKVWKDKRKAGKLVIIILLVTMVGTAIFIWTNSGSDSYEEKYANIDLTGDVGSISREGTYQNYLLKHADAQMPKEIIKLEMPNLKESEGIAIWDSYEGKSNVFMTEENSRATWNFFVEKEGYYYISIEYCPVESRGINAERKIYINGEIPFRGADQQTFCRFWTDDQEDKGKTDNRGNEIRAKQVEVLRWEQVYASDCSGYEKEPYCFYFKQGNNTLTLEGVSEPLALSEISLTPVTEIVDYETYVAGYSAEMKKEAPWIEVIQGEDAKLRSSPSLYASYDHSAPNTQPYSIDKTVLNMIGGTSWSVAGQWIEWEIEIPRDGWYEIAIKGRQNYSRGQTAIRTMEIDGERCFKELEEIDFSYSNSWQLNTVGDEREDYHFYLTEGVHTIRLKAALGQMGNVVSEMEDSVYRLNQMYRQLLVVMGRNPDKYRDYDLSVYPDMEEAMLLESKRLYKIADEMIRISGGKSSRTGTVVVLADMLEEFSGDMDKIKRSLANFRDNITALGATMQELTQSQLDIDYLVVKNEAADWPVEKAGFFARAKHEIKSFIVSFTTDYDSLGDVHEEADAIEVWILTGRDQANVLKNMIDDSFTSATGIAVNLKLVEAGSVLSAVAAGTGPDIVLSAGQGEPVNYALRGAAEDLTQFSDYEDVLKQFYESAYVPYLYEDGIYALPETQSFNVMFYRSDILEEMGLSAPTTWEELTAMFPVLYNANMEVGLPDIMKKQNADLSGFYCMMFQNGCSLYSEDGKRTLLDEEGAIKAFETYVSFYNNYDQPREYDFLNRFRSGEMPIGIADYSLQNSLSVFAPELKGLWSFALIPGTEKEDQSIDHSALSTGVCSMMLKNEDEKVKANCWEFLKWWTSSQVQARFGWEMECLMGSAARYATANVEAFQQLSWSTEQLMVLNEQRNWAKANREVAGGYYTGRHIINAVRKAVNEKSAPRETLLDYNKTINDEIKKKRAEFGLSE